MKIILMIPIILSIVTASMFIATISNNEVFAVCSESSNNENSKSVQCNVNYNYNSDSYTTTTSTPSITEEVEEYESSSDCDGILCFGGGLLSPGVGTFGNPLGDLSLD
jgi:hypothetical protein